MKFGVLLIVSVLIPACIVFLVSARQVGSSYGEALRAVKTVELALVQVTAVSVAAQLVLAGLLVAAISMLASHKIAGPLIRFERCVRQIGEGGLDQTITFREGDQNRSLIAAFHSLSGRLRRRVLSARSAEDNLRMLQREIEANSSGLNEEEVRQYAGRMREELETLRKAGTFQASS